MITSAELSFRNLLILTRRLLSDRKTVSNKFKYEMPGARYQPSVRLGRWDGKVAFFQLGGSSYINLLDSIIPILDNEGYDIDMEDLRTYRTQFAFDKFAPETSTPGPIKNPPLALLTT